MSVALIELEAVRFDYGGRAVLNDVSMTLRPGERLGLVGSMGSGKTTLLHLVVGLLEPASGTVRVLGRERRTESDFADVRARVGLVFQESDDQLFCPTVLEDVAFGPLNTGCSVAEAKQIASEALEQVGLQGFEDRVTYRLSGGEKRLTALATILAMRPEVLLLDEPQNGLDQDAYRRIRSLLLDLPQSMIIVSHDRPLLEALTTRTVMLENGRIAADVSSESEISKSATSPS